MSVGPWSTDKASPRGQWREGEERTGGGGGEDGEGRKTSGKTFFSYKERKRKIAHNMLTLQASGEEWC